MSLLQSVLYCYAHTLFNRAHLQSCANVVNFALYNSLPSNHYLKLVTRERTVHTANNVLRRSFQYHDERDCLSVLDRCRWQYTSTYLHLLIVRPIIMSSLKQLCSAHTNRLCTFWSFCNHNSSYTSKCLINPRYVLRLPTIPSINTLSLIAYYTRSYLPPTFLYKT